MPTPSTRMCRKAVPTTRTNIPRTTIRRMSIRHTVMANIILMKSTAGTHIIVVTPMLMITSKLPPTQPGDRDRMNDSEAAALYRLMTWLSPSFPVGAFSYSSGIEWAVESGDIADAASLNDWLAAMLAQGSGFCDGVFLAQAHRAASAREHDALREVELAAAFVPSRERHLETSAQGRAFIDIARAAWNCDPLDHLIAACGGTIVYPVAVGLVSAAHAIPLARTMDACLRARASNGVAAGAGLVALGQTDSQ